MENETNQKIDALSKRTEEIYISVEKTRKYFLATMIISVVAILLPIVGLLFVIPSFLSSYTEMNSDSMMREL